VISKSLLLLFAFGILGGVFFLYIFFGDVTVKFFSLFLKSGLFLFLSFKSILYVFCKYFSPLCGFSFHSLNSLQ
jgi:hypothetical protein